MFQHDLERPWLVVSGWHVVNRHDISRAVHGRRIVPGHCVEHAIAKTRCFFVFCFLFFVFFLVIYFSSFQNALIRKFQIHSCMCVYMCNLCFIFTFVSIEYSISGNTHKQTHKHANTNTDARESRASCDDGAIARTAAADDDTRRRVRNRSIFTVHNACTRIYIRIHTYTIHYTRITYIVVLKLCLFFELRVL